MSMKVAGALGAIAAFLLGVSEIGGTPIAPGRDTGFAVDPACDVGGVCFRTDVGDIEASLSLTVRVRDADSLGAWQARLEDGSDLHVDVDRRDGVLHRLSVGASEGSARSKFSWPSGVTLVLKNDSTAATSVENWRVYTEDGPYDSRGRECWRSALFFTGIVLLPLALVGAVVAAVGSGGGREDASLTADVVIRHLIESIEGTSPEDTVRVRKYLHSTVIGSVPSGEAAKAVLPPEERASIRLTFAYRAQELFRSHFDKLVRQLNQFAAELDEDPE